jgi:hypothetical protein
MRIDLDEAGCLRKLSHEYIDLAIERRRAWMDPRVVSEQTTKNLHAVCDVLLSAEHEFKLQVNSWGIYLYTNDCDLFVNILTVPSYTAAHRPASLKLTQAVINRPRNTVALKNPKHKHRSYFVCRSLSENQKKSIRNLLTVNQGTVRTSSALSSWLASTWSWTQSHHFIDHDDQSCLIMLSLIYPGLIKNTFDIVKS